MLMVAKSLRMRQNFQRATPRYDRLRAPGGVKKRGVPRTGANKTATRSTAVKSTVTPSARDKVQELKRDFVYRSTVEADRSGKA